MKTTSQRFFLIVLFMLVATSCVVEAVEIQAGKDNSLLHHLIHKREVCRPCPDFAGDCPSILGCFFCGGCCCVPGK